MRRIFTLLAGLTLFCFMQAQVLGPILVGSGASGVVTTTVEATCSGTTGGAFTQPCSGAMTVTAGDSIYCTGSGNNFDPVSMHFSDPVNGTYDNIEQLVHPNSADAYMVTAVKENSAGGSITPIIENYESIGLNFACYALKGTPTSLVVDGGTVNQTKSQGTTATNPTSGTAAAPTNANEIVLCGMVRPATATVTGGAGFLPGGTLTAVGSTYPVYTQYDIQTTATAVNCPYTASTAKYTDDQHAILNASNPAGYRALTGIFGVPAVAETNNASATVAILNGATATLTTLPNDGTGWAFNQGSAQTFTTAIAPTGTGKIIVQGVAHAFGDAGTSISFTGNSSLTEYAWGGTGNAKGDPMWVSAFMRIGSTGIAANQACDSIGLGGGVTDGNLQIQSYYDGSATLYFDLEPQDGGSSAHFTPSPNLALDTDFRAYIHMAGTNERNHQMLIARKSGTWSITDTFNYDMLCTPSGALCSTPTAVATTTGTASSGSTALVVASGTGIVQGQIVLGTNIADPSQSGKAWTTVETVTGTAVTLSQNTLGSLSSTSVSFYTPPATLVDATNGSVTGGSTAMTIVSPLYGTPAVGDPMGGAGLASGTIAAAIAGTSVTLSKPAISTMAAGTGVTFWSAANPLSFFFGRYSSCGDTAVHTYSGWVYDPFNDWGSFVPN